MCVGRGCVPGGGRKLQLSTLTVLLMTVKQQISVCMSACALCVNWVYTRVLKDRSRAKCLGLSLTPAQLVTVRKKKRKSKVQLNT